MNYRSSLMHSLLKLALTTNDVPLRIALIHSEISEMFEAFRKDNFANLSDVEKQAIKGWTTDNAFKNHFTGKVKDSFEDELADSTIRLLDLAGKLDIDIEWHIQQKMRYNETRGFKYGGKKF